MAIYHCSFKMLSRNPQNPNKSGCNALAAAAYRAGEKLGKWDYRNKGKKEGVSYTEIFTPKDAPEWVKDRYRLWESVEKIEMRKDSQLAREVEFAIPKELSRQGKIDVARQFAEYFQEQGMIVDLCLHKDLDHGHAMLSTRTIGPQGWGKKNRAWNDRTLITIWRKKWADLANEALKREGIEARISHLSLKDQGIDRPPMWHVGRAGTILAKKTGIETRSMTHNRLVYAYIKSIQEEKKLQMEFKKLSHVETTKGEAMNATLCQQTPTPQELGARYEAARKAISTGSMWEKITALQRNKIEQQALTDINGAIDYVSQWEAKAKNKTTETSNPPVQSVNDTKEIPANKLSQTPETLAARYKAARDAVSHGTSWDKVTQLHMDQIKEKAVTDLNWALDLVKEWEERAKKKKKEKSRPKKERGQDKGKGLEL